MLEPTEPLRFRSIFVFDVHLGTRGCRADCLLDFLRQLVLIGGSKVVAMPSGVPLPEKLH